MAKRILIVEDDLGTQLILNRMLTRIDRSFQVRSVSSAEEGYRALLEARDSDAQFDLVIADLCLPGSDGLVLWETAQRRFGGIDFLFVSATSYEDWIQRIYPIGKQPIFLRKPVTDESFRAYFANRLFSTDQLARWAIGAAWK